MAALPDWIAIAAASLAVALAVVAARRDLGLLRRVGAPALLGVVALFAFALCATLHDWRSALAIAALLPVCALIAEIDRRHHLIPDLLVAAVAALALAAPFGDTFAMRAIGAALLGALFYATHAAFKLARRDDALGLGDVKLAAAIGAFLGPQHGLIAIAAAGCATLGVSVVLLIRNDGAATLAGAPFGIGLATALAAVSVARIWGLT